MKNRGQPRHVSEILMPRRRVAIDWDARFAQLRERTLEDQLRGRCGTDAEVEAWSRQREKDRQQAATTELTPGPTPT